MVEKYANIGEIVTGLPGKRNQKGDILCIRGLGSCVGVVIYDPVSKIATLSHVAMPENLFAPNRIKNIKPFEMEGRYATTFIDESLVQIKVKGGRIHNLKSKIVGGAKMFSNVYAKNMGSDIGEKNVFAVQEQLEKYNIELLGKSVLGDYSRTMWYDVDTHILLVKIVRDNKMTKI
jgi:chemotaxis protein CheD